VASGQLIDRDEFFERLCLQGEELRRPRGCAAGSTAVARDTEIVSTVLTGPYRAFFYSIMAKKIEKRK
jgi:hypothetical protein